MAADTDTDAVGEYGEILTHSNIAQFLATQNWTCQVDRQFDQVWVQPGATGERVTSVLLPRQPSFVDYRKRLREAIKGIASAFHWEVSALAEQIAAVRADLFFVRVEQDSIDGTIPLRQATALLDSIDSMIRVAAIAAHNPSSSGRGRLPDVVNDFLNDDVRMGHTKKGSFIITVAARLDPTSQQQEQPTEAEIVDQSQVVEEPDEKFAPVVPGTPDDFVPSYSRQVMTTLARSLDITRRYAKRETSDDGVDLDFAVQNGLRLPLVQALQEMSEAEGLRSLDLSFEWAAAEPQLASAPSEIKIDRPFIEALPEIETQLTRAIEPSRLTIVGPVTELKRSEEASGGSEPAETGEIVIRADVQDRLRRITIPLSGNDYDWAITAHRRRLPFTVTGTLGKRGNTWRLEEPIQVDPEFLRFTIDADSPPTSLDEAAEMSDDSSE